MVHRHSRTVRRASLTAGLAIALGSLSLSPVAQAAPTPSPSPSAGNLSGAQAKSLSQGKKSGVIVLLKNQHSDIPETPAKRATRQAVVAKDQKPFLTELRQVGATKVKSYTVVNGFAAQVTAAEAARLAADPNVASVDTDRWYSLPTQDATKPSTKPVAATPAPKAKSTAKAAVNTAPGTCPTDPSKPLLEPEALQVSNTAFTDPSVPQASQYATGKGVKIAFIADPLDPNNPEFIRPDGSHVIVDYQHFSGLGAAGDARESFGDASSLAAQGSQVYDLSKYASAGAPLPAGCNVKIRGMAPGASLVALDISGSAAGFQNSSIVEAIDYAAKSNVDIINESLGGLPLPSTFDNPVVQANRAAVAAGITVVASTGDQGPTGTVGSPAMDPSIISAGGSTAFRVLAQLSWGGFELSNGKWVSNNISSFASGGTTMQGRAPDLVAPAERGWAACSTDTATYTGCLTYDGRPTNIFPFGGTSESSPLIAGEAALVIEAYAKTHHGAKPAPALIKKILTSTATDLGLPSDEQGAGLFNALSAVKNAMSWQTTAQTNALVVGKTQLRESAPGGSKISDSISVTNVSGSSQKVSATGRRLTTTLKKVHTTVTLNSSTATGHFFDGHYNPGDRIYLKRTFTVPAGADYLSAAIAYPATSSRTAEPQITLLDPKGDFVAESYTSAGSGFGRVDVRKPAAGTWTEVYATAATSGFSGSIVSDVSVQKFGGFGSVSPSSLTLKPGQTGTFHVSAKTGNAAGDIPASVQLKTSKTTTSVPWTVRTDISVAHANGAFSGFLSGANGGFQYKAYTVDVPSGKNDMSVSVSLQNPNQVVDGTLVDPYGNTQALKSDVFTDPAGNQFLTGTVQFFHLKPAAGKWLLVLLLEPPANGSQTAAPFTGKLAFNTVKVTPKGLPNSSATVLKAGTPVTATVTVKNTGSSPELFFVDGRLPGKSTDAPLISDGQSKGVPLGNSFGFARWPVPTQSTGLTFTGSSTVPIQLDAGYGTGDPSFYNTSGSTTAQITVASKTELAPGSWTSDATIYGPTGDTIHNETVDLSASVHTTSFDPALTSSTGDIWLHAISASAPAFTPVEIDPGKTATITVTLTPSGSAGTVVHGSLFVDTYAPFDLAGDELAAIPYTYKIG